MRNLILLASLALPAVLPDGAHAQTASINAQDNTQSSPPSALKPGWDVAVGGGLAVRPTYEGSNRDQLSFAPALSVHYLNSSGDNLVALDQHGLSDSWIHDGLRIGVGLSYSGGRQDSESNGIFNEGDNRLKGLGDIDSALGVSAFATYRVLTLEVTKFYGGNNEGVLANASLSHSFKLSDRWTVTPHLGTTWADSSYMQTYFGVTPTQAENSGFTHFTPGAGFKDVSAGLDVRYQWNEHWFLVASSTQERLLGDAAKSPISFSDTSIVFVTSIVYHF